MVATIDVYGFGDRGEDKRSKRGYERDRKGYKYT